MNEAIVFGYENQSAAPHTYMRACTQIAPLEITARKGIETAYLRARARLSRETAFTFRRGSEITKILQHLLSGLPQKHEQTFDLANNRGDFLHGVFSRSVIPATLNRSLSR